MAEENGTEQVETVDDEVVDTGGNSEEPKEVAPQTNIDTEGLLKEIQELRREHQETEERAEMLQEKLDNLETNSQQLDEEDEDGIVTRKEAMDLAKATVTQMLQQERMNIKIERADKALENSEHKDDFEKYLVPIISKRKSLAMRILDANDPVTEALDILNGDPKYRKAQEKNNNLKNSKKIVDNLNKPKNLSAVSGSSVGKKSPKDMTPEEFFAEQNRILGE